MCLKWKNTNRGAAFEITSFLSNVSKASENQIKQALPQDSDCLTVQSLPVRNLVLSVELWATMPLYTVECWVDQTRKGQQEPLSNSVQLLALIHIHSKIRKCCRQKKNSMIFLQKELLLSPSGSSSCPWVKSHIQWSSFDGQVNNSEE